MSLSASPPFLVNDPDHAPFGCEWLKGITPARIAVLMAVCGVLAVPWLRMGIIKGDYWLALREAGYFWTRDFLSAAPVFFLVIRTEILTRRWPEMWRIRALVAGTPLSSPLHGVRPISVVPGSRSAYLGIAHRAAGQPIIHRKGPRK